MRVVKAEDKIKFLGSPAYYQGLTGTVVRVSEMQPEVITVVLSNGARIVTDVFQVVVLEEEDELSKRA